MVTSGPTSTRLVPLTHNLCVPPGFPRPATSPATKRFCFSWLLTQSALNLCKIAIVYCYYNSLHICPYVRNCGFSQGVRPEIMLQSQTTKATSTPAAMSKQHCRMLHSNDSFDIVERCFDVVAVFRFLATMSNEFSWNFVISTKSKQIEHIKFVSTLSKGRNFTKKTVRHCCLKTATTSKQRSTMSKESFNL